MELCVALRGSVFGLALGFLELRSAKFRIVNRTFSVVLVTTRAVGYARPCSFPTEWSGDKTRRMRCSYPQRVSGRRAPSGA